MRRRLRGQAVVLLAVMVGALCLVVALAIDSGIAYVEAAAAQRAADAAALAGVVYMPYQFDHAHAFPAGSNNDAVDRAVLEAKLNGFDTANTADKVTVTVAPVPNYANRLQVTVSRAVPFAFTNLLPVNYTVSRTSIAAYLPPITLGQPGNQVGATVSQLGVSGYYFMRTEGWATDRQEGDAFTPNPAYEYGQVLSPASSDVHKLSVVAGTLAADPTLPARGGENFLVQLPAGGSIQVYNAAFAPEASPNYCENARPGSAGYVCSPGDPYSMHENDSFPNLNQSSAYSAMRYTIYSVNNLFVRAADTKVTQMTVFPIVLTSAGRYRDINTGANIAQTYDAAGNPTNMKIYHSWIDLANYTEPAAADLVTYSAGYGRLGGNLPSGTYRLRVDTLDANGAISGPGSASLAHKGYAIRVLDASGRVCSSCSVSAWNDMTTYTPVKGGSYSVPLFSVPPDYAGKTISVYIYDPGDISSGSTVSLAILNPSGAVASAQAPQTVAIYDLGISRSNAKSPTRCLAGSPTPNAPCQVQSTSSASVVATQGAVNYFNGHWLDFELPIPATYAPGTDPNNWWWSLRYTSQAGTTANDTITVAVGFGGTPSHLIG